jgi:LysM repeat protein
MVRHSAESTPGQKRSYQTWIVAGAVIVVGLAVLAAVRWLAGGPIGPSAPNPVLSAQSTVSTPSTKPGPNSAIAVAAAEAKVPAATSSVPAAPSSSQSDSPSQSVDVAIAQAIATLQAHPDRLIEARDGLDYLLKEPMNASQSQTIKAKLSELADQWLWSQTVYPGDTLCQTVTVQPGDQLRIIGERNKVPYELLMAINRLPRPEALKAGQTLKVVAGPFHAKICRSTFTLDVYLQTRFVKSYRVGLGKPGYETPTGLWIVKPGDKHIKPQWTDPDTGRVYRAEDADYPLGARWIGLEGVDGNAVGRTGFALHGTNDPNQIGRPGSRGCIRLYNDDVVTVYNMFMPGLSKVQVVD